MKCERVQDIILTDYVDGFLTVPAKAALDAHVAGCSRCREFLAASRKALVEPFQNLPRETMPLSVMNAVMDQIKEKEQEGVWGWLSGLSEGFSQAFSPSFAMARIVASVMVCFLVAGVVFGVNKSQQVQTERVSFLAQVAEVAGDKSREMTGYGTTIETYFFEERGNS
ncbi:MAG: zf-HC2 domain-containing protein [Candidatus Omnitrophica bacterium]|nr:zf-HC2 domain-containing protein [Candidatus Omnitrophota bacterium]